MATFLLDTSVIIDTLNEKKNRRLLLKQLVSQGHTLAICAINVAEIYAGIRPNEEERTRNFLGSLDYRSISFPVAELAGLLKRDYARKGITLSLTDTTIAAVGIHYQLTLMTDNIKDFPMRQLNLYPLPRS
jgi:tRNA(fMet)-specific endonuclease VapC